VYCFNKLNFFPGYVFIFKKEPLFTAVICLWLMYICQHLDDVTEWSQVFFHFVVDMVLWFCEDWWKQVQNKIWKVENTFSICVHPFRCWLGWRCFPILKAFRWLPTAAPMLSLWLVVKDQSNHAWSMMSMDAVGICRYEISDAWSTNYV